MAVLTLPDEEEYVTYLTELTKSADITLAEQALATLLKYGFNPAEPRAAGRWTSGGTTTTTSETSQRRSREQRQRQAQSRYEDAAQGNDVADRLAQADLTHSGNINARALLADARKKYRIPVNPNNIPRKKRAAAARVLRATIRMARLKAQQEKIAARVAAIDAEAGHVNATDRTRVALARRRTSAASALQRIKVRIAAAQQTLAAAADAWGGHKAKKKSVVKKGITADLLKADGERIPKPGQKYRHGWIPIEAGAVDTLGLNDKRPRDQTGGATYHASHRIEGTGSRTPVHVHISSFDDDADPSPQIGLETSNPEGKFAHLYTDERGGPMGAVLDVKGARQAADHLRDLATIADSGQKIDQPKPTKHSRTAAILQNLIEEGKLDLNEKLSPSGDGDELPITHRDLLDMLAVHIPPPTADQKKLRRVVKRPRSHDEAEYDSGDVHMHLDTSGAQPIVHVAGRERGQGPWDPATDEDTAHLTPAAARELAEKLDQYANALPKPGK